MERLAPGLAANNWTPPNKATRSHSRDGTEQMANGLTDDQEALARDRIRRLFEFLREFNQRRHPVTRDIDAYLRKRWWHEFAHGSQHVLRAERKDSTPQDNPGLDDVPDDADASDDAGDFILRVAQPAIIPCPKPSDAVAEWLRPGWDDPTTEVTWSTARWLEGEEVPITAETESRLLEWKDRRDSWAGRHRDDYAAAKVFDWLWQVKSDMDREAERFELVLGDGLLTWEHNGVILRHPLILQPVQLDFDPRKSRITVVASERPPEFYAAGLRAAGIDGALIRSAADEARDKNIGPLSGVSADDYYHVLALQLHPRGRFIGSEEKRQPPGAEPVISRNPVLFLRDRAQGFEAAISAAIDDIRDGGELPMSLVALVGVFPAIGRKTALVDKYEQGDEAEDILLTKEANGEQLEIARRLERYGSVLVQGPPGTGKTHTIANLIGHFLAKGERVLVTSHSTKALRVLREKVVDDLQPLCVSVLEGDSTSNEQLKQSAETIAKRLSETTAEKLEADAARLRSERKRLLDEISRVRAALIECVGREYREISVMGSPMLPMRAAAELVDREAADGWIPGNVSDGPLPLAPSDVYRLYRTSVEVSPEEERALATELPDLGKLPTSAEFEAACIQRADLAPVAATWTDAWASSASRTRDSLELLRSALKNSFGPLATASAADLQVYTAGVRGDAARQPWQLLATALRDAATASDTLHLARQSIGPALPAGLSDGEALATIEAIIQHLNGGGGLGGMTLFTRPSWKKLIKGSGVLGRNPATVEDFRALRAIPEANAAWEMAAVRYRQIFPGASLKQHAVGARRLATHIEDTLSRYERYVNPALELTRQAGLYSLRAASTQQMPENEREWQEFAAGLMRNIDAAIDAELARLSLDANIRADRALQEYLARFPSHADALSATGAVYQSVKASDPAGYGAAHARLAELVSRTSAAATRRQLLGKLRDAAPAWAHAIESREAGHGEGQPPGDPEKAWQWKQLARALDDVSKGDVAEMTAEIARLRAALQRVSADLIDRMAWAGQTRRTTPAARQSLMTYVGLLRRIGRGTGRRAPALRVEARKEMESARGAVPVWIAPMTRVAESFVPGKSEFDVVIIDEASQLDMMGLLAWYMGKKVIVVGDDQQVTPDDIGTNLHWVAALAGHYLAGIPGATLFDGQESVYHHAQRAFSGVVRLREHFRCVPDIISFSNGLSYHWEILPLRPASAAPIRPHVIPYHVPGLKEGDINREEARHIAALVQAVCEDPEYKDKTIGVISLLGQRQGPLIEQMIHERVPIDQVESRRLLCGNPAQFQGDERDIIFLSLVDSPAARGPLSLRGDPGDRFKKRFNVAVSRAKDQVWVVHSLDPATDLQANDLRRRLLDWAIDPTALDQRVQQAVTQAESPFEADVMRRLVSLGYEVEAQHPAGAYRIDIVVRDGPRQLAVECDGDRFHGSDEQIRDDLFRQAILERMKWTFHRIRGSQYYRDPDREIRRLCARLEEMGIKPGAIPND